MYTFSVAKLVNEGVSVMMDTNIAKKFINEGPEKIKKLEKDLDLAKDTMSEEAVHLIESGINQYKGKIAEAKLSLKFTDYQ